MAASARIDALGARAYRVPTEGGPEADGTLRWQATHTIGRTTLTLPELMELGLKRKNLHLISTARQ